MNSFESESIRMRALNRFNKPDKINSVGFIIGVVVYFALFIAVIVPTIIYFVLSYGFVFSKLWAWFLIPIGLPAIGVLHAAGIIGLLRLVTHDVFTQKITSDKEKEEETSLKIIRLITLLLTPWLSLGIGAVLHYFM